MSTIAFARMTRRRRASRPLEPGSTRSKAGAEGKPTPVGKATLDTLAALVPAEVLVAHATILQVTTETKGDVTTITKPEPLGFAFWALVVASAVVYLVARAPNFDRLDWLRMLIPPLAFVGWTMIQKTTAFDAAFSVDEAYRVIIPVIAALIISVGAASLAYKADAQEG